MSIIPTAHADTETSSEYAEDIFEAIDMDELNALVEDGFALFENSDFASVVNNIINGNFSLDYSDIFSFILSLIGVSIGDLLTLMITVVAIAIVYSILGALKGNASSESIGKIVHFASLSAIIAVVGSSTMSMFTMCADTLSAASGQINVILPIILTLMASVGASGTASVFQPAVAVLTSGLFNLLSSVLLPMLIAGFAFGVIGNLTGELKLGKTADFFNSSVKWLFGVGFFIISAFLSVQGITASVFDGISVRSAKFTIGKFVPVIGGYLSDGFNLVISGGVLVKNALGYTTLLLLASTLLPAIIKIGIYSLCLRLCAATVEPLGDKSMSNLLSAVANTASMTGAVMTGAAFLYFVFVLIIISSGNVIL
ncbi:MAG: stage III sporulation protein AE [Clostridia bacterium]|nr:stage III sporulation protein AE [Clostridia bacterium]